MKTSIQNRNYAYFQIVDSLCEKRREIYFLIQKHPNATAQFLAELTGKPINEITGRITELKNLFLIVQTGSAINRYTKKPNATYRVVNSLEERASLINSEFIALRNEKERLERDYHQLKNEGDFSQELKDFVKSEIKHLESRISALDKVWKAVNGN